MTYRNRRFRGDRDENESSHDHRHWHDHGHRHGHGRGRWRRQFGSREELISGLERYQRNLEERAADVAETIRRLRAKESSGAETPEGTDATPTTHNV
jgi:hypothetical protein